ncbi:MAG: type IV pili twitching motility protein PilT [Deltaproteobacteria bacterium HGW-Deltaproteobacteria-15]|nr:MAG: type IV pili twitching motility protein PilT [Deltaproteobacteria bacterium HGW-Deltaproteobacteria-15]
MAKINELFREMKEAGASDLHLATGFPPMLRLKGEMSRTKHEILTNQSLTEMLYEILSPEQQHHLEEHRDLDAAYELEGVARFRCNFFYQHRGISAVFRIIPTKILTIEDLKLPSVLYKIAEFRRGLVVVTGPTGSGKSTTLAAIVDQINKTREAHILTIEDPIEFVHPNIKCLISQREAGVHAHNFAEALRVATREDPDIILVGEMRDLETISLALTCASLGILVFGTLHTNSAAKTIDRIVDAFPSDQQNQVRSMLGDSVQAIIAQQLLRTKDGKGRCAVNEILLGSPALANMIREGKVSQIPSLIQGGASEGMQTMDSALMKAIREDRITPEAAYEKGNDKSLFAAMLTGREES